MPEGATAGRADPAIMPALPYHTMADHSLPGTTALPPADRQLPPPDLIGHCWHCGTGLIAADYGRENHCLTCGKATRCCGNCSNFKLGRPNDCLEPVAEPVGDKERANFCEWFAPGGGPTTNAVKSNQDIHRQAAEALFR